MALAVIRYEKWLPILSEECIKEFEGKKLESHDLSHSLRVWKNAEKLGGELGADMEVLIAAVFLHDVGVAHTADIKHGRKSADVARGILERIGFPEAKRAKALEAIEQHDDVKNYRDSIEAKILFDCDNMDAFGAIGVFRYLDIYLKRGWNLKDISEHVYGNLQDRFNSLHFEQSKEMCREDYEFSRRYFLKLKNEFA
jgi:uncharacterized protein